MFRFVSTSRIAALPWRHSHVLRAEHTHDSRFFHLRLPSVKSVDSYLVSVLPYEWPLWEELLAACSFGKNWMIITKYYKSHEVSFLHLFAVQTPREEGGNPPGSTQVWMVERHVYKSYNTNPNLWIFSNDTDFHQMTEEDGEEGKMSISEALVSFSNFIHWLIFLC